MTRTWIGAEAHRTRRVTQRDVVLFTEITGDANPLHYDAELAARSRFGGLVVQGGVTSGLLNALVAEQLPGPGSVFLEVAWRFLAPVRPGSEITARAVVTDVREDKPVTTLRTTVTDQDGVVVLDGTAVVWRDPVVAAATEQRAGAAPGKAGGKAGGSPGEGAVPSVLDDQHPPMPDQPAPAMEDR